MGEIVIEGVTRIFGGGVRAVDDVSLTIQDGEFLVLVGPSGCGKTTLLRMIAGLEDVSQGSIHIGSDDVTDAPARQRDIAMVFQNYALYPHMSVRENLAFCLKMQKVPKQESRQRVSAVAEMLGLGEMLERKPSELSGGQRQRVAMGRAIVREPKAFLMDEPLSNLDAKLRVAMRTQLVRLHERLGTTTVYVTHDQVEAMTLGHRVAVMRNGRILQIDTPQAIYARPENLFVAAFIGSPSMNLVEAEFDGEAIEFAGFRLLLDHNNRPSDPGTVIVGIRPEAFEDASLADPALPQLEVVVEVLEELGSDTHLVFPVDAPRVETEEIRAAADGEDETLFDDDRRTSLLNARVDPTTSARAGERFKLSVNPRAFHFFDPASGVRLDVARVPASA